MQAHLKSDETETDTDFAKEGKSMEEQGGKEGRERDDEDAFTMKELQPLPVRKSNEKETKSNQSQNNCTSLLLPSDTKDAEIQLVGGSDENEHNNDGLDEIVEEDGVVEADQDSNTEKEHREDAKEREFNELELKEVGENSRVVDIESDIVPSEATGEEEIIEIVKEEIVVEEIVEEEIVEIVEEEIVQIVEEEIVEEESEEEDDHQTDILTPALSLLIFNISMPCVDLYFDASLIRILFFNNWGCLFVLVCALATNFLFTAFAWWRIEPKSQKAWSWIFLVLQIWPQLKAVQVNLSILVETKLRHISGPLVGVEARP